MPTKFIPDRNINNSVFTYASNPTANDDSSASKGYAIGDKWVNTTTNITYICTDATINAAVWVQTLEMDYAVRSYYAKIVICSDVFTGVGNTETYSSLWTLPAGGIVNGVKLKHRSAWTGGGATTATLSVGGTGSTTKYCPAFNVFQAASATAMTWSGTGGLESHTAGTALTLTLVVSGPGSSTGGIGTALADIWFLYRICL